MFLICKENKQKTKTKTTKQSKKEKKKEQPFIVTMTTCRL